MTSNSNEMLRVMKAIIAAWHKQDVEGVLAQLTDDIVWHNSSGYAPAIAGKAAMRSVLQTMAPVIQTSAWRMFDFAVSGNCLFTEGVDEFWTKSGGHIAIPYAGIFEFRGPLICNWREYYDGRISSEMKNGAPLTDEIRSLIERKPI